MGLFVKLDITFKSRTRLKIYSKFATVLTNITYLTIPTQPAYRKIKAIDFIRNSIKLKSPLHRRASNSNNKKDRKTSVVRLLCRCRQQPSGDDVVVARRTQHSGEKKVAIMTPLSKSKS